MSDESADEPRDLMQPMTVRLQPWPKRGGQSATLFVCINRRDERLAVSCAPRGGGEIAAAVERGVAARGLNVRVKPAYCLNACMQGPNIKLLPSNTRFYGVRPSDVPEVLDIIAGQLRERDDIRQRLRPGQSEPAGAP